MVGNKLLPEPPREILDTLAGVAVAISVAEFAGMALVPALGIAEKSLAWLADAGILVVLATPMIIALLWQRLREQSWVRVAVAVAVILASVEITVMGLLSWLGLGSSAVVVAMLDASLVVLVSLPLVCLVLYRSAALSKTPEQSWQDYTGPRMKDEDR